MSAICLARTGRDNIKFEGYAIPAAQCLVEAAGWRFDAAGVPVDSRKQRDLAPYLVARRLNN